MAENRSQDRCEYSEAFFRIESKNFPRKNLSEEKAQFYLHFPFFMLKLTKK